MMTYRSVDGKLGIPTIGRDDLDNAVLSALGRNLAHVLHGIFEFLLSRPKRRRLGYVVQSVLLGHLARSVLLSSAFHR